MFSDIGITGAGGVLGRSDKSCIMSSPPISSKGKTSDKEAMPVVGIDGIVLMSVIGPTGSAIRIGC